MKQLTVDSGETVQARIKADPEFAEALLREATDMFLNGESGSRPPTASRRGWWKNMKSNTFLFPPPIPSIF